MSKYKSLTLILGLVFALVVSLSVFNVDNVRAGDLVLSNNSGTASTRWFISGEASLVMNGFDLQSFNVALPTRLDRISISVSVPTPNAPVEAVVYQDANGGSPADATLIARRQVTISTAGVFTVTFDQPVTVSQRFLWVGFYLPVDFEFLADTSGSSVLTYWAWEPNATFDLATLSAADVLGPADGSAPVNINMNGVARITAELITGSATPVVAGTPSANARIRQIVGDPNTDLTPMSSYVNCGGILYDAADVAVTYSSNINIYCRSVERILRPADPVGYDRKGGLFDVYLFGVPSGIQPLPHRITHCVRPNPRDLNQAVIGLAYGAPRQWEILPTVRFGEWVCAEITHVGFISYFVPES